MTGLKLKNFNKRTRDFIEGMSQILSDYYPETMQKCFVVNAPFIFTGMWAVVKVFLDERTRSKIKIYGEDFH